MYTEFLRQGLRQAHGAAAARWKVWVVLGKRMTRMLVEADKIKP